MTTRGGLGSMLTAGQTLYDRYQLQEKLGQSAGRQTWLALDLNTQSEPIILKLLAFGDEMQWEDLKLFERESQILRQLDHPRIPKCRDSFSIDDRILWFGLVQDYIAGTSLKQFIQDGKRFTEEEVRKFAIEILEILQDLHQLNPPILHRDIKPSNLILSKDEQIYLIDFGAVQDRAPVEGGTFTVVGTYGYTPIEQFGGRAVAASDLYALGTTLIHLLTGTAPADLPQRYLSIQWRDRVTLTPTFADWIDRLAHPDVEQRFQTANQAIQALQLADVSSFHAVERPKNTRVQLQRSKKRLEIVIPKQNQEEESNFELLGLMMAGVGLPALMFALPMFMLLLVLGVVSSAAWILLFALMVFLVFISPSFQRTYVKFDRKEFVVETQRFRAMSNRMTGVTRHIRDVRRDQGRITITSGPYRNGYHLHQFGEELTDFEQAWVLKEIRSWLKLKSD
ncbi:MAG: serine/threonine protein kinase [Leptolyngbya sp. Prado105]|nr:serine/threonine protein kinase [Leptolyngbya sp. Prado105]